MQFVFVPYVGPLYLHGAQGGADGVSAAGSGDADGGCADGSRTAIKKKGVSVSVRV